MKRLFLLSCLFLGSMQQLGSWSGKTIENQPTFIEPRNLAAELEQQQKPERVILFVGFPVLYKGGHIRNAVNAGPASKDEGLSVLRLAASRLPRSSHVLIYCGCCPMAKCPNIRPAYTTLHDMGFQNVQIVHLETNFHTDWAAHGYPIQKG